MRGPIPEGRCGSNMVKLAKMRFCFFSEIPGAALRARNHLTRDRARANKHGRSVVTPWPVEFARIQAPSGSCQQAGPLARGQPTWEGAMAEMRESLKLGQTAKKPAIHCNSPRSHSHPLPVAIPDSRYLGPVSHVRQARHLAASRTHRSAGSHARTCREIVAAGSQGAKSQRFSKALLPRERYVRQFRASLSHRPDEIVRHAFHGSRVSWRLHNSFALARNATDTFDWNTGAPPLWFELRISARKPPSTCCIPR